LDKIHFVAHNFFQLDSQESRKAAGQKERLLQQSYTACHDNLKTRTKNK
jgi:hypothetical protein